MQTTHPLRAELSSHNKYVMKFGASLGRRFWDLDQWGMAQSDYATALFRPPPLNRCWLER